MTNVDDRRIAHRKRTLRAAKIVFGDYRYTIDCVIRDRSETGARIRSPNATDAPNDFYLFEAGQLLKCHVAWRRGDEMGLHFEGEPISVHESADPRLSRFRFIS